MTEQILIVEDDLAMSNGIRDVLEMNGYRVQLAENGAEGLKALEFFHPDLIISDIMMPEMDGFEFLERVSSSPVRRTLHLLTARSAARYPRRKQLGADDTW
jgi:CheY-like chemotaxis protein